MSIEAYQSVLLGIRSQNPNINNAAETINNLTELCKEGNISTEEYAELLLDLQRKINIEKEMAELEVLAQLNMAINGLISIAKVA